MNSQLMQDIKAKAQQKIHNDVFRDATGSKAEIDAVGAVIAKKYGGFVSTAGIKSEERAGVKVASDYAGDWLSIKDLARMTLIVPQSDNLPHVLNDLKKEFSASKGRGVIDVKIVEADRDPCGYSSTTVFVRTSNGRPGEIQINTPPIIYAKQHQRSVVNSIGQDNYLKVKMTYQLQGGLGHIFYEIYRANLPGAADAAELSRSYYQFFRNRIPDFHKRTGLEAAIAGFFKRFPQHRGLLHHH
jgi:hypothetical protein